MPGQIGVTVNKKKHLWNKRIPAKELKDISINSVVSLETSEGRYKYNQCRQCHTWNTSRQSKVLPWFPFHWEWRKTKDKNRYVINLLVAKSSSVPYILVEVINYIFKRSSRQKTAEPKSVAGKQNPLNRGNHQHFLNFVFISSLVNA